MRRMNYLLQITNNILLKDPNEKKNLMTKGQKKRSKIDTYFHKKKKVENTEIILVWPCNCHIIMSVS